MEKLEMENIVEKTSFKEINSPIEFFREAPDKRAFMRAMKEGRVEINGEDITPIDFFSTGQDLSDDEIVEAIEGYLDIESIDGNIDLFNETLEKSKDYIENYLRVGLPGKVRNLEKFRSKDDIIKLFRKTTSLKKSEGMGFSNMYCALISVMAADFEFRKRELETLLSRSEYVYEKMISSGDKLVNFNRSLKKEEDYDEIIIRDRGFSRGVIIAQSYFRGKSENSFISKFMTKPRANAEEASKDGIGIKFEVKTKDEIKELIPFLVRHFKSHLEADAGKFKFENTKLLDEKEFSELSADLSGVLEVSSNKLEIEDDTNPHSNKKFEAFKISGSLEVPEGGSDDEEVMGEDDDIVVKSAKYSQKFEIQIVLTDNENESGNSDHNVYEAVKKMVIMTRLFGVVPEEYLYKAAIEARLKQIENERGVESAMAKVTKKIKNKDDIKKIAKELGRLEGKGGIIEHLKSFLIEMKPKRSKAKDMEKKTFDRLSKARIIKDVKKTKR